MSRNALSPRSNGESQSLGDAARHTASSRQAGGAPASPSGGIDLSEIIDSLRQGKWVILATCVLVTALVGGYTYTLPSIYASESIVSVDLQGKTAPNVISFGEERSLSNEVGVLRYSADLAMRVVEELQTTDSADGASRTFPVLYAENGSKRPKHEVAGTLLETVQFSPYGSQSMIGFSVESQVPEEASTIVNLYAREYKEFSKEKARASVSAAREFLEQQAEKRREDIRRLEQQWENFAQSNQVVIQGADGQRLVDEYTELSGRKDQLGFELEQEQSALKILRDQLEQFQPGLQASVLQEQQTSGLRSEIAVLEQRIGELRAEAAQYYVANPGLEGDASRIRSEFPALAETLKQVEGLEKRKRELTQRLVAEASDQEVTGTTAEGGGALERVAQLRTRITEKELTISQIRAQIRALDERLAGYQPRLSRIPQQTIQREQIERKLSQAEAFYESITAELQRTIVAEESELGYVEVVRSAFVPSHPVAPDMKRNLILGILLGVGFGLGLAFLRQAMTNQLDKPEDLQRNGYNVLGVVPDMRDEVKKLFKGDASVEIGGHTLSTRLLPLLHPWSPITENYRLIRTNLQFAPEGEDGIPRVILITSPDMGEGKTTTAVNLALTYVLGGRKVLFIDADMRRPSSHRLLDLDPDPGLSDMLRGRSRSVIRKTYIDGLYYVAAGRSDNPPTEDFDSDRMRQLLAMGRERCDVVIVDSPPVLAASDALVLSTQCDAVVAVTSAESTSVRALELTRDMLRGVGVEISGVVFNRYRHQGGRYRYGYYQDRYEADPDTRAIEDIKKATVAG